MYDPFGLYGGALAQQLSPTVTVPAVPGENGAKSYPLGKDSSVILADSTADNVIWLKVTDSYGNASYKRGVVNWESAPEENKTAPKEEYVTVDKFNELYKKVDNLLEELNG